MKQKRNVIWEIDLAQFFKSLVYYKIPLLSLPIVHLELTMYVCM